MARRSANAVLFGTGDIDPGEDPTGFDTLVADAEAAEAAEAVEIELPAEVGEDGLDDESEGDAEDESDDDEGGDGDDSDADVAESVDEVDSTDPVAEAPAKTQLRFKSQTVAEQAYAEVQAEANRLRNQLQAMQSVPVQQPAPPPAVPSAPPEAPVERFNWALEQGNDQVAINTIARVRTDSNQMSAQAALARSEQDEATAQMWDQRAMTAESMAQQMVDARNRAQYEAAVQAQVAPIQEERFTQSLSQAASKAMNQGALGMVDVTPYEAQIGQFVQANPQIMGQWSPAEMEAGFAYAATEVVFGGQQQMIDWIVQQRVAEAKAAAPAPKPKARGTAGGSGRRSTAPLAGSDAAEDDEIRASVSSIPNNGMKLLFNN